MKLPETTDIVAVVDAINVLDLTKLLIEVRKYMAKETGFVFYMNPADSARMWQYIPKAEDFSIRRKESSVYVAESMYDTWQLEGQSFTECLWRLAYLAIVLDNG